MDGLIVGLDLCDTYTQVSCFEKDKNFTLPTVICRQKSEEAWHVGEEAYAYNLTGDGIIVDKLLRLAQKEGSATICGVKYEASMLLKLFLSRALELPKKEFSCDRISQLVITVPYMDGRLMDTLTYCGDYLGLSRDRIHIISHSESFIYYVLSQKKELWNNQVGLFDLSADRLSYFELKVQRGMKQMSVIAEREDLEESFNLDILETPSGARLADRILSSCSSRLLQKKLFSTIFLTGKGFESQDWAGDFMKVICPRRRVYVEQALFSAGAAYRASDYGNGKTAYPFSCICEGRLKTTVSMKVMVNGKENQLTIASAGDNWYESKSIMEFITDKSNEVELFIAPMDPKRRKTVKIPLEGFPERPERTTRIEIRAGFLDESTMALAIKDKGFGELFPASEQVIRREVSL